MFVGTDVSRDRPDVHVRPAGGAFAVARDGEGLDRLAAGLRALAVALGRDEVAEGGNVMATAACTARKRWVEPGLRKPCILRSRSRIGTCEPSARLFADRRGRARR